MEQLETLPGPRELPRRPAWVEIDLNRLKRNYELINQDKGAQLQVLAVVKDDGYATAPQRWLERRWSVVRLF